MGKCVVCGKGNIFSLINSEGRCPDCEVKHRRELRNKNSNFEFTSVIFEENSTPTDSPAAQPKKSSSPVLLFFTVFLFCILFFLICYIFYTWRYAGEPTKPLSSPSIVIEDPALAKAIAYLSTMPFSEEGLYNQLIFEGFRSEELV